MISDFLVDSLLDHVLGSVDYSPPATIYIALFTSAPSSDGSGGTEAAGGDYTRVALTNNQTNFPDTGGDRIKTNGTAITFPQASAGWGSIVGVGVYDASTSGNMLFYGALTSPRTVAINDQVSFAVGQLKFTAVI